MAQLPVPPTFSSALHPNSGKVLLACPKLNRSQRFTDLELTSVVSSRQPAIGYQNPPGITLDQLGPARRDCRLLATTLWRKRLAHPPPSSLSSRVRSGCQ